MQLGGSEKFRELLTEGVALLPGPSKTHWGTSIWTPKVLRSKVLSQRRRCARRPTWDTLIHDAQGLRLGLQPGSPKVTVDILSPKTMKVAPVRSLPTLCFTTSLQYPLVDSLYGAYT